jgi:hypothetical protein
VKCKQISNLVFNQIVLSFIYKLEIRNKELTIFNILLITTCIIWYYRYIFAICYSTEEFVLIIIRTYALCNSHQHFNPKFILLGHMIAPPLDKYTNHFIFTCYRIYYASTGPFNLCRNRQKFQNFRHGITRVNLCIRFYFFIKICNLISKQQSHSKNMKNNW